MTVTTAKRLIESVRALENMGYKVHRVRNKQVESSPFDVAGMIVDRYYQIMEVESEGEGKDREKIPAPKIKKTSLKKVIEK